MENRNVVVSNKTHELILYPVCGEEFLIRSALFMWYTSQPGVNRLTCPRGHEMVAAGPVD